jgi:hypothetical protein
MLAGCIVICRTTVLMPLTDAVPQAMVIVHLPVYASQRIRDADEEWSDLTLLQPNELRSLLRSPSLTSPVVQYPPVPADRVQTAHLTFSMGQYMVSSPRQRGKGAFGTLAGHNQGCSNMPPASCHQQEQAVAAGAGPAR